MTEKSQIKFYGDPKSIALTGLVIIGLVAGGLYFSESNQNTGANGQSVATTNCDIKKKDFNKRLKEITWDKSENDKLITDDFYNKYLKDIQEFKTRNEYVDLYYHSIPDIETEKCLVIIKTVFKYDLDSYSYKLVDLGQNPKVIFELAALEDYPDGQRRIKSIFLDDNSLRKTKVTEYLGDHDEKADKYEIITDSLTLTYGLQDNEFVLTKSDSIRTIKK